MSSSAKTVAAPSIQFWLDQAHALRSRMYEAEAEFYLYLVDGEAIVPWRGAWASYEKMLTQNRLCDSSRFASFRNALKTVAREDALKVGVDGVIRSALVGSAAKREELLVELRQFAQDTGHPPSRQNVNSAAQRIAPIERPGAHTIGAMARDKLEAENHALRRRVAALESEVRTLKAKIAGKKSA